MNDNIKNSLAVSLVVAMSLGIAGVIQYSHIRKLENSLSCRETTYLVSYNLLTNNFDFDTLSVKPIYPRDARKRLEFMTRSALGDFNSDGIQDTARINEVCDFETVKYPMQMSDYHKELKINGKRIGNNFPSSNSNRLGFTQQEDVNKDGIKDLVIIGIDYMQ